MKQVFKAQMSSSIEQILLYQMLFCYTIKAIRTNVKWTIFVGPNVVLTNIVISNVHRTNNVSTLGTRSHVLITNINFHENIIK